MAGPGITEAEVDLDVDGGAILKAIDLITTRIGTIQTQLRTIVETAATGATGFDRKLSDTVKALQSSLGQISTLEKTLSQGSKPIAASNQNQALARQTTNASVYAKTLKEATNSADALQARLNDINKKIAGLGAQGQLAKRSDLSQQLNTKQAISDLQKLENELVRLDSKARRTNGLDVSGDRTAVLAAQKALLTATTNGSRSNFTPELQALADAQARYADSISTGRAKAAQSLVAYRQQARALAVDNSKDAQIEKAYREQEKADRIRLRELAKQQAADEKVALAQSSAQRGKLSQQDIDNAEHVATINRSRMEADRAADIDRARRQELVNRQNLASAKEQAAADARSVGASKNRELLDQAQARSAGLIAAARERMANATGAEARKLTEIVQIEKERAKILAQEAAIMDREAARAARPSPAAPGTGPKPTGLGRVLNADYIGAAVGRTAIYGAAAAVGYGALGAMKQQAADVVELEDKLKTLQAISGATDNQLRSLSGTIIDVGKNSRYSLSEIADAATTLAQAGFSVADMQKSLGAVTVLAAASGSSLGQTVDVVTSAIGSFQLQTSETTRVTDVLLSALNRSKLTLSQVGEAIQYVGSTAYESNITLEQLVASAGAMAQAGIKSGSTIGTGLRQFIIDLQTPSEKLTSQMKLLGISFADIDIKTRGLPAVIQTLTDKGFGAAQAYGALETRAAAAFLTLKNNLDVYDSLILAEAQQGAAAAANAKAMDSLSAQWIRFKNILTGEVAGAAEGALKILQTVIRTAGDAIEKINELGSRKDVGKDLPSWMTYDLGKPIGGALSEVGYGALNILGRANQATGGRGALSTGAGDQLRAWADAKTHAAEAAEAEDRLATATANASDQVNSQTSTVGALDKEIARLLLQHQSLSEHQQLAQAETVTLSSRFSGLALQINGATDNVYNLIAALRSYRREQLGSLGTALTGEIGALRNERAGLNRTGGQQIVSLRGTEGYSSLTAREKAAIGNPTIALNAQIISDAAARTAKTFPQLAQGLNSLSATAGKYVTLGLQQQQKSNQRALVNVQGTATGQAVSNQLETLQARFGELQSGATGKTSGDRAKVFTSLRGQVQAQIKAVRALQPKSDADRQFRDQALTEFESLNNQIQAIVSPTTKEAKSATTAAHKLATQQAKAGRKFNTNQRFVDSSTLKVDDLDLAGDIKDAAKATTFETFEAVTKTVDSALTKWVADRDTLAEQEITSRGLTGPQAANYRREVAAEIQEKQENVARALADGFNKMIDAQIKAINNAYDTSLAPYQKALARAQGASTGLGRVSLAGQVPDFVKTLADRRVAQASEAFDNAQIPALETKVVALRQQLELVQKQQAQYEAGAKAGGPNAAAQAVLAGNARQTAEGLQSNIDTSSSSLVGLQAAQGAAAQIPKTLTENLKQAAEAYQFANQTGLSFTQMLSNNMTDALSQGQGLLTSFFDTILSSSGSALSAFRNFGLGIMKMMEQIVAKMIATKIIDLLLSLAVSFGGSAGKGAASSGAAVNLNPAFAFNGGRIGLINGGPSGLVTNGSSTRDSVDAKLARGEFVMRKKAVDSLGVDFVAQLNKHGAGALAGTSKMPVLQMKPSNQQMSVYVVPPESKPSLGANDVLLIVNDDLLKGGQTKQLVKHISQGG